MAYAPLHPGQPLLPRYLSGTATGVPSRALRIESQQVPSAWRLEKNELSVFLSNVLHAKETRVEPQRALQVFDDEVSVENSLTVDHGVLLSCVRVTQLALLSEDCAAQR